MHITGVMIQYYFTCKRELWFFSRRINFDFENEDMILGKILHQIYKKNEFKEIIINNEICIDIIKKENTTFIVYEVKKSSKLSEPSKYQLYYYLYYLKKNYGLKNIYGIITYPKENKSEKLILTECIEKNIEKAIEEIKKIIYLNKPPKVEKKPYCKKCSYYEFCWC